MLLAFSLLLSDFFKCLNALKRLDDDACICICKSRSFKTMVLSSFREGTDFGYSIVQRWSYMIALFVFRTKKVFGDLCVRR